VLRETFIYYLDPVILEEKNDKKTFYTNSKNTKNQQGRPFDD